MSIQANELVWRRAAENSDAGTNGGRMTSTAIPTAVKNNLFPDVPNSERTVGSSKFRKAFIHVANGDSLSLVAAKVFATAPTPGDDFVVFFPGTQTDVQSGIGAPSPVYGAGKLNAGVSAGATSVQVLVENWASAPIFIPGMTVRISNKATINSGTGTEEYMVIDAGGVSVNVNVITLTLTAALANAYLAADTYVSSVYAAGNVVASATNPVVTGGGSYDYTTYPIVINGVGSIEQDWTCSFPSSATQFTLIGNTVGSLGTFNISSDAAPVNPSFSVPYLTINRLGWNAPTIGTQMTFTTHPAAIPIWYKRVVPAGAASLSGNKVILAVDGESA
jgi:hypothetical protein